MDRRAPCARLSASSAASDVYKRQVHRVTDDPDHTKIVDAGGHKVVLYTKNVARYLKRPCVMLVAVGESRGGDSTAMFALRVYHNFLPDIQSVEPLALLSEVVERFGVMIEIMGTETHRAKMFLHKSIRLDPAKKSVTIGLDRPIGHLLLNTMMMRQPADSDFLECSLCFCLDVEAYQKYLSGHKN